MFLIKIVIFENLNKKKKKKKPLFPKNEPKPVGTEALFEIKLN
jgi:hypothetical protein